MIIILCLNNLYLQYFDKSEKKTLAFYKKSVSYTYMLMDMV